MHRVLLPVTLALATAIACGGDDDADEAGSSTSTAETTTTVATTTTRQTTTTTEVTPDERLVGLDPCSLLSPADVGAVTGLPTGAAAPERLPDEDGVTQCRWAFTSPSGDGFLITGVAATDSYDGNTGQDVTIGRHRARRIPPGPSDIQPICTVVFEVGPTSNVSIQMWGTMTTGHDRVCGFVDQAAPLVEAKLP